MAQIIAVGGPREVSISLGGVSLSLHRMTKSRTCEHRLFLSPACVNGRTNNCTQHHRSPSPVHQYRIYCTISTGYGSRWPEPRCFSGFRPASVCLSVCACTQAPVRAWASFCMCTPGCVLAHVRSCMHLCVSVCNWGVGRHVVGVFVRFLNIAALLWLPLLWCHQNHQLRGSHFGLLTPERAMTSRLGDLLTSQGRDRPCVCVCWGGWYYQTIIKSGMVDVAEKL